MENNRKFPKGHEGIYQAINDLTGEIELSEGVEFLTDAVFNMICYRVDASIERTVVNDKEYTLTEKTLSDIYNGLTLIKHFARIYEVWEAIEWSELKQKLDNTKEVSSGN